jgi:protoporphyrinogen oxidase
MHIYDYIIIGSGLTGLTIAQKLSQETSNILVLEAHDFIGGDNRSAKLNDQEISNGLRFFPATESSTKAIEFLESILKTTLVSSKKENKVLGLSRLTARVSIVPSSFIEMPPRIKRIKSKQGIVSKKLTKKIKARD